MNEFEAQRGRMLGIAYRLLGSFVDAEDVVQETWIAWDKVDRGAVADPGAYLARAVTHRALNRVRTLARQREDDIGSWLPEPVATERLPDEAAEMADSLSFAMLVLMEQLSPLERAAFILREVFALDTAETAEILGRTPVAVRKLVSRARARLDDAPPAPEDTGAGHDRTSTAFVTAIQTGDIAAALSLLSPSVELVTDGGGKASAARKPVVGADAVLRFLVGALDKWGADSITPISVNHRTALLIESAAHGRSVYQIDVHGGRIQHIWATRNPDKLTGLVG